MGLQESCSIYSKDDTSQDSVFTQHISYTQWLKEKYGVVCCGERGGKNYNYTTSILYSFDTPAQRNAFCNMFPPNMRPSAFCYKNDVSGRPAVLLADTPTTKYNDTLYSRYQKDMGQVFQKELADYSIDELQKLKSAKKQHKTLIEETNTSVIYYDIPQSKAQRVVWDQKGSRLDKFKNLAAEAKEGAQFYQSIAMYKLSLESFIASNIDTLSDQQIAALRIASSTLMGDGKDAIKSGLKADSNFVDFLWSQGRSLIDTVSTPTSYNMDKRLEHIIQQDALDLLDGKKARLAINDQVPSNYLLSGDGKAVLMGNPKASGDTQLLRRDIPCFFPPDSTTDEIILQTGGSSSHSTMVRIWKQKHIVNGQEYYRFFRTEYNTGAGCHNINWSNSTCDGTYTTEISGNFFNNDGSVKKPPLPTVKNYNKDMKECLLKLITAERRILLYKAPNPGPNGEPPSNNPNEIKHWKEERSNIRKFGCISKEHERPQYSSKATIQFSGNCTIKSQRQLVEDVLIRNGKLDPQEARTLVQLHFGWAQGHGHDEVIQSLSSKSKQLTDEIKKIEQTIADKEKAKDVKVQQLVIDFNNYTHNDTQGKALLLALQGAIDSSSITTAESAVKGAIDAYIANNVAGPNANFAAVVRAELGKLRNAAKLEAQANNAKVQQLVTNFNNYTHNSKKGNALLLALKGAIDDSAIVTAESAVKGAIDAYIANNVAGPNANFAAVVRAELGKLRNAAKLEAQANNAKVQQLVTNFNNYTHNSKKGNALLLALKGAIDDSAIVTAESAVKGAIDAYIANNVIGPNANFAVVIRAKLGELRDAAKLEAPANNTKVQQLVTGFNKYIHNDKQGNALLLALKGAIDSSSITTAESAINSAINAYIANNVAGPNANFAAVIQTKLEELRDAAKLEAQANNAKVQQLVTDFNKYTHNNTQGKALLLALKGAMDDSAIGTAESAVNSAIDAYIADNFTGPNAKFAAVIQTKLEELRDAAKLEAQADNAKKPILKIKNTTENVPYKPSGSKLEAKGIEYYSEVCKKHFNHSIENNTEFKNTSYIPTKESTQANDYIVGELRSTINSNQPNANDLLAVVKHDSIECPRIQDSSDKLINVQYHAFITFLKVESELASGSTPATIEVNYFSPLELKEFLTLLNKTDKIPNIILELPSSKEQCIYGANEHYTNEQYQLALSQITQYNNPPNTTDSKLANSLKNTHVPPQKTK